MACISDNSDELLRSRIEDVAHLCDKRCAPCFLGFLDLREQALAREIIATLRFANWSLFGGYDGAERAVLAFYPDFYAPDDIAFPITAVAFRYRPIRKLTHRDVLGTLLSAGIRRDTIGDILCGDGLSVAFLREEIADFVCEQIDRIGGEGVTALMDFTGELPIVREYEEIHETVASPRLDAVVKALVRCSREKAAESIRIGCVSVDHRSVESVSLLLTAPCTVSIRGSGRYLIDQIGPKTKKGRLLLVARKCI